MIDIQVSTHGKFTLEFKIGFITNRDKKDIKEFSVNTWIFVPNSLDINRTTYTKDTFYKDVKNNIRLITPIYSLDEILKEGRGPLPRLDKSLQTLLSDPTDAEKTESYLYQIKMLLCIVKSALRREHNLMFLKTDEKDIISGVIKYIQDLRDIASQYRSKWELLQKPEITKQQQEYFLFGDDFLGNIIEQHTFAIMRRWKDEPFFDTIKPLLNKLLQDELEHKKERGFYILDKDDKEHNSLVIIQRNILKKFVESDLFLHILKKKDGAFIEQFYYSIAAGVAMIFATVISFFATQRYGNFTTDLFIVLVISYMLKDRIKDLMRYFFTTEISKKYFDSKLKLSIRKQEIGWVKESFDFIEDNKLPEEVRSLRNRTPLFEAENQIYDEKIILYRKLVNLSKDEIEKYKEYHLSGINDITRFNLANFIQKMDNPSLPLYMNDEEKGFVCFDGVRVYSLYFILKCQSDTDTYYKKYRILFNRDGIVDVKELSWQ